MRANLAVAALAVAAVLMLVSQGHAQSRSTWVYESSGGGGGYFEHTGGGNWTEVTDKANLYFREVERTPDYVQLHDASRKISVRIYATKLYIHYPGSGGWQYRYTGAWE